MRDKAIYVLSEMRTLVKDDWRNYMLKLILEMIHDEKDNIKESGVKLINEVAADMGQEMCEGYIVNELRGLCLLDDNNNSSGVKCITVQNLNNISKNISIDAFNTKIFPLYDQLAQDKEWKVRKTCADVVA